MKSILDNHSLSITVDIEDWYHIPSVTGAPFSIYKDTNEFFNKWTKKYDYLSEPTKKLLDLLDEFSINATFFVVADVIEHYPGLVESICEKGHEIACHGLHHNLKIHPKTKKPLMDTKEFKSRTLKAKKLLEKIYNNKIIGYRAPGSYVAGWMLDALEELGFKYDSSVCKNSLYNKTDSTLRDVHTYPYYPKVGSLEPGKIRNFTEVPLSHLNLLGFKTPTSGGPFLRFFGENIIRIGLKQNLKKGHSIMYFHPIDISQEKFPKIGNKRPFYWIIKGKVVEKRIKNIIRYYNGKVKMVTVSSLCKEMINL